MLNNKFLYILLCFLAVIQVLLNNIQSEVYFNLLAAIIIISYLNKIHNVMYYAVLFLLADILSMYPLGSHLLVAIVLSFVVDKLLEIFEAKLLLQRIALTMLLFSCSFILLCFIDSWSKSTSIHWLSLLVSDLVVIPLLCAIMPNNLEETWRIE